MISISRPLIGEAEKEAVLKVLESGMLVQGKYTAEFEEKFAHEVGVNHAIAVSNGTSAILIALMAHGINKGDEVITSPFTFIATASAILMTGATPVFVDIRPDTYNIDSDLIDSAITEKTKAILPVHLYGHMCDMDPIMQIAEKYGLSVIEDACQAVNSQYKGKSAGSYGTGTFSLYATKNIHTAEGGMITTNDDEIARKCRLLRNHGMEERYQYETMGFNFRMTEIQSAIGIKQLERLPDIASEREKNANFYTSHIKSVQTPVVKEGFVHAWHQYTVSVMDGMNRDYAIERLLEAGIGVGVYYPHPLHQLDFIKKIVGEVSLPVVEKLSSEVFSIPVHPQLSDHDLEFIVEEVNKL